MPGNPYVPRKLRERVAVSAGHRCGYLTREWVSAFRSTGLGAPIASIVASPYRARVGSSATGAFRPSTVARRWRRISVELRTVGEPGP
jgi:hypothetical protein